MPTFDLKCGKCDHVEKDVWLKPLELPLSDKSETYCSNCDGGLLFRVIGAPAMHWRAGEYGGDSSKIHRVEMPTKMQIVDTKESQKQGRTVLKDV